MLVSLTDAIKRVPAGRAVGAFNVIQIEHAEAYVHAAEVVGVPVVMQISENCIRYHEAVEPIVRASVVLAEASSADVVVHLDHMCSIQLIRQGLAAGASSVMYDGSTLPWDENLRVTREVRELCGEEISLEAELGEVGGKDGAHAPGVRTDPVQAREFAVATDVDALAVAIGNSHAMTTRTATPDHELIRQLAEAVPVPLVMHGSSGVPDDEIVEAVRAGIRKVNIATHLNHVWTNSLRDYLTDHPDVVDTRKYFGTARAAVTTEVERLIRLISVADEIAAAD